MSNPQTRNRRRAAGLVAAGGAAALFLGTIVPAGAAVQDVTYALSSGVINVGGQPYDLPASTGVTGTWDDVSGDFEGSFTSSAVQSSTAITDPLPATINLTYEFQATAPVTGNIDPTTGTGSVGTTFDVEIYLQNLVGLPDPLPNPATLDMTCTIADVPVTFDVTGSDPVPESTLFNALTLTASEFSVPSATCVSGPGNQGIPGILTPEQLLETVNGAINGALGTPTSDTTSTIDLVLGEIPPPPPTTRLPPTPSTTAGPGGSNTTCESIGRTNIPRTDPAYAPHLDRDGDGIACEAPGTATPARPVSAQPRLTG